MLCNPDCERDTEHRKNFNKSKKYLTSAHNFVIYNIRKDENNRAGVKDA